MSTKPEPDDRPADAAATNPFGDDEQPWFIRQVRAARLDPNDNVLPMRSPIPKAEAFNWPASAKPAIPDVPPDKRSAPGDADWLAWTPPPMDPVAPRRQRRDLRWPLLAGLVVIAVLLAFGAGWLLRDRVVRQDVTVPVAAVPAVPAPVVRPAVKPVQAPRLARPEVKQTAVQPTIVKPMIEKAKARHALVVAKPIAKEPKPHAKPAIVAKTHPSLVPARVIRPAASPAVRKPFRAADVEPRSRRAPAEDDRAAVPEAPTESRGRPAEREDDAVQPPASSDGPSDLLAGIEPQAEQADDGRSFRRDERRRARDQRGSKHVLPRCVGFQVSRPNVACRVGGPR